MQSYSTDYETIKCELRIDTMDIRNSSERYLEHAELDAKRRLFEGVEPYITTERYKCFMDNSVSIIASCNIFTGQQTIHANTHTESNEIIKLREEVKYLRRELYEKYL